MPVGGLLLWLATCAGETPETYIRQFKSMNPEVRTKAGNELIRFEADQVVPLLIEESDSEYIRVRFEVMRMLGRFKDPRGVPTLTKGLDDKSPRVAAMAAAGLSMVRAPEALSALLMYSRDPSIQVRQYAIGALGPCHSYELEPTLSDSAYQEVFRALGASKPKVRMAALQSMREFGYRGASERILEMAHDPSPEVRHVVVQALGEIGAAGLGRGSGNRSEPIDPLEMVDDGLRRRIVQALIEKLDADEYQSIRTKAIRGLGEIGDHSALGHLERLQLQGSEDDRREARRAAEQIRPPAAVQG